MQNYKVYQEAVEDYIHNLQFDEQDDIPQPLRNAMYYSLKLPGKRLRPVIMLAFYNEIKEDWEKILPFACGIEMIHTYSLIHDDLPQMDNDEIRRGKPTNHIIFGEDIATLAGDALLSYAFEHMLENAISFGNPLDALRAVFAISKLAGASGMIAGQTVDVALTGNNSEKYGNKYYNMPDEKLLQYIHQHKTGDMIVASVQAGLILAGASEKQKLAGILYAKSIGLSFQITDDLLDILGDTTTLGKQVGKDIAGDKLTWPKIYGIEKSKQDAMINADNAIRMIDGEFEDIDFFKKLAYSLVNRVK